MASPNQNHLTKNKPHSDAEAGHGSFAAGFLIGVVTGAVGLWTAQHEDGKKIIDLLKKEWEATLGQELGTNKSEAAPASSQTASPSPAKKFPKFTARHKPHST